MQLGLTMIAILLLAFAASSGCGGDGTGAEESARASSAPQDGSVIALPSPTTTGVMGVTEAIAARRSVRSFAASPVSLAQAAQLLWAAQGVTDPIGGRRSAPSAGALYPLEAHLIAVRVTGLEPGVYRYAPERHALLDTGTPADPEALAYAALSQESISTAPALLVLTAVFERSTRKYGERGVRYVYLEAGHAAENVYLEAVALGLGTVAIGAFDDERLRSVLGLPPQTRPVYLMPFGLPAGG